MAEALRSVLICDGAAETSSPFDERGLEDMEAFNRGAAVYLNHHLEAADDVKDLGIDESGIRKKFDSSVSCVARMTKAARDLMVDPQLPDAEDVYYN